MEASGLGKNGTDRAYSSGLALEQNFNLTDAQHFQHMPGKKLFLVQNYF